MFGEKSDVLIGLTEMVSALNYRHRCPSITLGNPFIYEPVTFENFSSRERLDKQSLDKHMRPARIIA